MPRDRSLDASTTTFEDFYMEEFPAVVRFAFVVSGNVSTAEDIAQEAFLAAHRQWDRISSYAEPRAWVRRVVANKAVSAFRRQLAEARAMLRLGIPSQLQNPELEDQTLEFWDAVRSLPRRQTQVVALFYLEDRAVAEIAEILGMAEGTVKKHLHDGRRRLADLLRIQGADDDRR